MSSRKTLYARNIAVLFVLLFSSFPAFAGSGASTINESIISKFLYVSTSGTDSNSPDAGSSSAPYRTVKKALAVAGTLKNAGTGVKVIIREGLYREGVPGQNWAIQYSAFNTDAPLVIEGEGWDPANP